MKSYICGYLFVRLNKLLAVLAIVVALLLSVFVYIQAGTEADASKYVESDVLPDQLQDLKAALAQTQSQVTQFAQAQPKVADYPSGFYIANSPPAFALHYTNSGDFRNLDDTLKQVDTTRSAIKSFLTVQFDSSIQIIHDKLLAHAREIASTTTEPSNQTVVAPPEKSPDSQVTPQNSGLFSFSLKKDDLDERKAFLADSKQALSILESDSEDAANKSTLNTSILEIENFTGLFPQVIEVSDNTTPSPEEPAAAPRPVLNAVKVAQELSEIQQGVDEAMTSSWTLDERYEKALDTYEAESDKCKAAEREIRRLWRESAVSIGKIIIASFCVAFGLMVLADLTKAILDTAANTGVVGDAYRIANIPHETIPEPNQDFQEDQDSPRDIENTGE